MKKLVQKYLNANLILRIAIGLIIGVIFGLLVNLAYQQEEGFLVEDFSVNFAI